VAGHFGSAAGVSRGVLHDTRALPGMVVVDQGERIGLLQYRRAAEELEIVVLIACRPRRGVGRHLLEAAKDVARPGMPSPLADHHERQCAGARVLPGRLLAPVRDPPRRRRGGAPPEAAHPAHRPCRGADRGRDRAGMPDRPAA
jgi:hypothetical protein